MAVESSQLSAPALQSHKPAYSFPLLIWGCAATFFFYQFVIRVYPSVSAEQIMADLSIQACAMGVLASWYYYGYAGMQIIVGLTLDHIGVKYPLTLAALLCVAGCYLFATTDSLLVMSIGRFLMGVGSAFGFLSCVKTASIWFNARTFSILIGWAILIGPFGGSFGTGTPMASLVEHSGWRGSVWILGMVGLGIAALVLLFVRDHPLGHGKSSSDTVSGEQEPALSVIDSLKVVFHNSQTYRYGLFAALMYVTLAGFADLWGKPFVVQAYNVSDITAAGSVSMFYLGIGCGGPIGAWIISQLRSYKKYMFAGASLTLLMFLMVIYLPLPAYTTLFELPGFTLYVLDALLFVAGLCASSQFFAFACVCELNPKGVSATATGIQNMAGMISGIIFQPFIGFLLDWSSKGVFKNGIPFYSKGDYALALGTIPLTLFLALLVLLTLKEAYPDDR